MYGFSTTIHYFYTEKLNNISVKLIYQKYTYLSNINTSELPIPFSAKWGISHIVFNLSKAYIWFGIVYRYNGNSHITTKCTISAIFYHICILIFGLINFYRLLLYNAYLILDIFPFYQILLFFPCKLIWTVTNVIIHHNCLYYFTRKNNFYHFSSV